MKAKVGDIIKLKAKYSDGCGVYVLLLSINKIELPGDGGWVAFDYSILTKDGQIMQVSETCVDRIVQ
ncbi:MAG: hypothetical protein OR994_06340 [Candidatus Poseidoniales archaeon]|nr:hypothetical protein [Candidatus Poseidoniales archaeon]